MKKLDDMVTSILIAIIIMLIIGLPCLNLSCRRHSLERLVKHLVSMWDTIVLTK